MSVYTPWGEYATFDAFLDNGPFVPWLSRNARRKRPADEYVNLSAVADRRHVPATALSDPETPA